VAHLDGLRQRPKLENEYPAEGWPPTRRNCALPCLVPARSEPNCAPAEMARARSSADAGTTCGTSARHRCPGAAQSPSAPAERLHRAGLGAHRFGRQPGQDQPRRGAERIPNRVPTRVTQWCERPPVDPPPLHREEDLADEGRTAWRNPAQRSPPPARPPPTQLSASRSGMLRRRM
jgi:hypothetical protein